MRISDWSSDVCSSDLLSKVRLLQTPNDDGAFFDVAGSVLNWSWEKRDERQFARFKQRAGIPEFGGVALPQVLVAAGFFSNIVMLDFDQTVIGQIGKEVTNAGWLRSAERRGRTDGVDRS